jgi:acetolactate synthase-1/2/3 large subunit
MDTDTKLAARPAARETQSLTGAQMVVRALKDQGVTHIFGYPGGAVLPICASHL